LRWLSVWGIANKIDEKPVNATVGRKLGMKCGSKKMTLADEDRGAIPAGKNLDAGARFDDLRGANENHLERAAGKGGFGREDGGVDLAAVGVALDNCVEKAEGALRGIQHLAGEKDRSRAGAKDGLIATVRSQGFEEFVLIEEAKDGCRLAAGQDEAIDAAELLGFTNLDRLGTGF
jgi:hypothetical protein